MLTPATLFLWIRDDDREFAAIGTAVRDGNDVLIATTSGKKIRSTTIAGRKHLLLASRAVGPIKAMVQTPVPGPKKYPDPGTIEDLGGTIRLVDGDRYARHLAADRADKAFCDRWHAAERLGGPDV